MRAAIYARYSTENQREASIDDQYRGCEAVAKAAGLTIVLRLSDAGISGGTEQRPGYQSLLAGARAHEYDIIVTEDVSRLWRNRASYGVASAELEDLGVHLLTCVGEDTRREGWGLVIGIKQAIAEAQRKEISYRTRRGLEGLALAGKSTGGRCYGFQGAAIHPQEASVVRQIFDRRVAGLSLAAIASELTAAGVPSVSGGAWSRFSIRTILGNPRYTGAVVWGRTQITGGARDSRNRRKVARAEPLVSRQDNALQIVDAMLWAAVAR